MSEYAWMCLNKQDSEYASGPKYGKILDMAGFSICSEYARICLDRVLNICWVLNMPGFWIWQGSENAHKICHNMPKCLDLQ